ncbi:type III secretion apparatus assembly chaperone SctY [Peristeroidobacter soli]|uniref:type III secretion apparatus assembly chaperone SctY n=1 Tax=Peristeroidobacter soli TaxID=2497877 RepID=UPI00101DF8F4|nr:tetratricopeptide repeat protein [Peristeroidobacter soli]
MHEDERTLLLLLAYVHLQHSAPAKAETLYAALVALNPNDALAAKGLACARLESGKPKAALAVLDGIVGPGEPSAVVQLLRARAFAQLDQSQDAQVAMRAFAAARTSKRTPAPRLAQQGEP